MFGNMNFTLLDLVVSFEVDGNVVAVEVIDESVGAARNQAQSILMKKHPDSEIVFKSVAKK